LFFCFILFNINIYFFRREKETERIANGVVKGGIGRTGRKSEGVAGERNIERGKNVIDFPFFFFSLSFIMAWQ
jgi:hypothetical protein